jgi:hypothetical protein
MVMALRQSASYSCSVPESEGLSARRLRPEGANRLPEGSPALLMYEGIGAAAPLPDRYCWVYGALLSRGGEEPWP